MYPYLRLARVLTAAPFRRPLRVDETGEIRLLALPTDMDLYPEVNNGRQLTLLDLGRVDFAWRTGMLAAVRRRRWNLVIGGVSVRFRHRMFPFRNFRILTRLLGHDERWFYLQQAVVGQGRTCTSALLRGGLRSTAGLVSAQDVLAEMGVAGWHPTVPSWVQAWIAADAARPWPPDFDSPLIPDRRQTGT